MREAPKLYAATEAHYAKDYRKIVRLKHETQALFTHSPQMDICKNVQVSHFRTSQDVNVKNEINKLEYQCQKLSHILFR